MGARAKLRDGGVLPASNHTWTVQRGSRRFTPVHAGTVVYLRKRARLLCYRKPMTVDVSALLYFGIRTRAKEACVTAAAQLVP